MIKGEESEEEPSSEVEADCAIASENKDECSAFYGELGTRLQITEASDDFGNIAGAAMFFIIGEEARRTIAVVGDFETGGLEAFNKAGGT